MTAAPVPADDAAWLASEPPIETDEADGLAAEAFTVEQVAMRQRAQALAYRDRVMAEPAPVDEYLEAIPRAPDLPPDQAAALDRSLRTGEPLVTLERVGPSYRVTVEPPGAEFLFRDVRTDRDLSADVTVRRDGRHVFRSTSALSLTGRDRIAKTAAELDGGGGAAVWRRVTFLAAEAVMDAVEQLTRGTDLRTAPLAGDRPLWVARPFWPAGSAYLIAPGESGKSTAGRALAVSLASGETIIPGVSPEACGPVVFLAAEDPNELFHARSIEAICRGAGLDRARLRHPILFVPSRGRPLHRLVRSLAERAADAVGVILDAQQGLLATGEQGNIRDQAAMFWNAVDELDRPTLILAHPNLEAARNWDHADGRAAGSEVNRDRARISWRGVFRDEPAIVGTSYRRYTLTCTKYNHGPQPDPLSFAVGWEYGSGNDPGTVRFTTCEPVTAEARPARLSKAMQPSVDAYRAGAVTPTALIAALPDERLTPEAAKKRIQRIRDYLAGDEE